MRALPVLLLAGLTFLPPLHAFGTETVSAPARSATAPVVMCVDPDWWPFEAIDERGRHVGIAADLIGEVAARAGLVLTTYAAKTWEESVAASKAGKCQLASFINQTPEREQWLIFTEPLLIDPNVLITREDMPPLGALAALQGYSMAIPKQSAIYGRVRDDFPNLKLIGTDSEYEAFAMVSERRADMTLRSQIVAGQNIKEKGWFNLKIANAVPGYENVLRMGVLKSAPELRDQLNSGIASLTRADRERAINRYVEIKMITGVKTDYTLVIGLAVVLLAVVVTSLWWMRRLHRLNVRLKELSVTDGLTGLLNRTGLAASFQLDVERAQRYRRPLSVILLDLDHFKRVNDEFGHLMGDRVLVDFAALIKASARQVDASYRWGGEEFLIVCHETPADQARLLAERILDSVRRHSFPNQRPMTVSAGMATLRAGDTLNSLTQRADEALYLAKAAGRDRLCEAPESSSAPAENVAPRAFVELIWKPAYACGNARIDQQHQRLFVHANRLLTTMLTGQSTPDVAASIDVLLAEVAEHFKDEEAILAAANYAELAQHVVLHRQLADRALELLGFFRSGRLGVGELFQFLANDVVARHMLVEDRKYFAHLA